jgi:hypothetical protein
MAGIQMPNTLCVGKPALVSSFCSTRVRRGLADTGAPPLAAADALTGASPPGGTSPRSTSGIPSAINVSSSRSPPPSSPCFF